MNLGPAQVITACYLCLTAEVLGTMVVFMGRRVQLLEKNAQRASTALSARYVLCPPPLTFYNVKEDFARSFQIPKES
jgi:hypothetical protein